MQNSVLNAGLPDCEEDTTILAQVQSRETRMISSLKGFAVPGWALNLFGLKHRRRGHKYPILWAWGVGEGHKVKSSNWLSHKTHSGAGGLKWGVVGESEWNKASFHSKRPIVLGAIPASSR